MKGTITKLNQQGLGIIVGSNGSRLPFMLAQSGNQNDLQAGQEVIFSVRMINNIAFAQNVMRWVLRSEE